MISVFSNYSYRPLSKEAARKLSIVLFCLAFVFLALYIYFTHWLRYVALVLCYLCYFVGFFLITEYSTSCEVDDEQHTLKLPTLEGRKPMQIDNIDIVTRHTSKKGKFRYLNIHEKGVRFAIIRLKESIADQLIAKLLEVNPHIQVKTANYS